MPTNQPPTDEMPTDNLSTYSLPDLLRKWSKGELTPEQAIGHLIQHGLAFGQRLSALEKAGALRARQLDQPPVKPHV
jgi:hypothetical protein